VKASTQRSISRILHLLGAAIIGTYVYSPWKELEWFVLLNQAVVVPALTVSGLWMWQGHKLRARAKRRRSGNP